MAVGYGYGYGTEPYHQTFMGTSAWGMILTTLAVDSSARVSSVG
ncbi:hypothetical protein AB0E59_17680 [Lentzea sp. NPDC034063]